MENGQEWKSQMTVLAKMGLTLYLSRKLPLFTCTQIYLQLLKSKKLIIVHCQTPTTIINVWLQTKISLL